MTNRSAKSPQRHRKRLWEVLVVSLCCLWPLLLPGQIFRYQDEQGNWHFTDDPPDRYESSVVPDIATSKKPLRDAEPTEDLAARLHSAYSPTTPIAYATLAVVSIRTGSGEGSGFFCSDKGHVLTNKHVVRPEPREDAEERERTLEEKEHELKAIEAKLKEARDQLRLMEGDLKGYEELIVEARDDKTRSWAEDARRRLSQHYQTERGRVSSMERNVRTLKPELRNKKRELSFQRRAAPPGKRFDIVLKDGTKLVATLSEISNEQDLALLKVDGLRTPFLRLDPSESLSQGMRVFAIGNPLGIQDAVTSGVLTQITPEHLLTDAQILPGSSGGPLIRENGEVVGINVSRKVAAGTSKYAAGFSKVIPIALAIQEFPTILTSNKTEARDGVQTDQPGPHQTGAPESHRNESTGAGKALSEGFGPGQIGGFGQSEDGTSDSATVRLIVPGRDEGLDSDKAAEHEPRSLDFPPEGSGVFPSGISWPRE